VSRGTGTFRILVPAALSLGRTSIGRRRKARRRPIEVPFEGQGQRLKVNVKVNG